jgi:hypothetical protein
LIHCVDSELLVGANHHNVEDEAIFSEEGFGHLALFRFLIHQAETIKVKNLE